MKLFSAYVELADLVTITLNSMWEGGLPFPAPLFSAVRLGGVLMIKLKA